VYPYSLIAQNFPRFATSKCICRKLTHTLFRAALEELIQIDLQTFCIELHRGFRKKEDILLLRNSMEV
jgi:hypothetical protein